MDPFQLSVATRVIGREPSGFFMRTNINMKDNNKLRKDEARALERTLSKIRKCVENTYLSCTPFRSLEYVQSH
jgi:hypothetical protein